LGLCQSSCAGRLSGLGLRARRHATRSFTVTVVAALVIMSATSSANSNGPSGNPRCPAHSGPLNFVAAEADRQISGQPYHPKAKPRKFMTFRQLSNSEHSADDIQNDTDLTHHFIPKSRLKIAWSNENRTMNRAMPRT